MKNITKVMAATAVVLGFASNSFAQASGTYTNATGVPVTVNYN